MVSSCKSTTQRIANNGRLSDGGRTTIGCSDSLRPSCIASLLSPVRPARAPDCPDLIPSIPGSIVAGDWRGLKGLRDFLAHNYPAVVVGIIASTLDDDLPVLVCAVRRHLAGDDKTEG